MLGTAQLVPPIGTKFVHGDPSVASAHYVVTGYAKKYEPVLAPDDWLGQILYEAQQTRTSDNVRLVFCERSEAEYVIGAGVAGCVVKVAEIAVEGFAAWDTERLSREQKLARMLVGKPLN